MIFFHHVTFFIYRLTSILNRKYEVVFVSRKDIKAKRKLIIYAVLIGVIIFISLFIVPQFQSLYQSAVLEKNTIYYANGMEPDDIDEWIDLMKYTYRENIKDVDIETSYDDIHKYSDPAWLELKGLPINKNLNNNYHVQFKTTLDRLTLTYNVYVDDNIAKIELNASMYEYDEENSGQDVEILNKNYNWYLHLENGVITAYTRDFDGNLVKTSHDALIENCIAFDLDTMLAELSKLEPQSLPMRWSEEYPSTREEYGNITLSVLDPYIRDDADDTPIIVFFSNYPKFEHRLDAVHRYFIPLSQLSQEHSLEGLDETFDKLAFEYNITAREMMLVVQSMDDVEAYLPQNYEAAVEVDNFQFIADDILAIAEVSWQKSK